MDYVCYISGKRLEGVWIVFGRSLGDVLDFFFRMLVIDASIATLGPTWNSTLLQFMVASWGTKWHDYVGVTTT